MSAWDQVEPEDYEDLRIAVVMNGGVSLAIWIGGVACELNRLTTSTAGDGSTYGALLNIVKSAARVDVLSGTSAGGINAGFLALAASRGTSLKPLGELWADKGSLLELLRDPMDKQTPSLMRGDDYFLKELNNAFANIERQAPIPRAKPATSLDLTMTTTIIKGKVERFVDNYGTPIVQKDHRGRFHFVRDENTHKDAFGDSSIVDRLARASRSTASFPFAFEPSFIPVGAEQPPAVPVDRYNPRFSYPDVNFRRDRFVIDGGVLMNMPVKPALEAIFRQPADKQVRRVLLYVNPDPGQYSEPEADRIDDPYAVTAVMSNSMVTIPSGQSISEDLNYLQEHNRRARDRRRMAPNLLENLLAILTDQPEVLAEKLFPTYQKIRIAQAVSHIADVAIPTSVEAGDSPAWTDDEIFDAFVAPPAPQLPFVPTEVAVPEESSWNWGLAPVMRLGFVAVDLLRRSMFLAPFEDAALRARLRAHRDRLHDQVARITELRNADGEFWRKQADVLPKDAPTDPQERRRVLRAWAESSVGVWAAKLFDPNTAGYSAAAIGEVAYELTGVLVLALPDMLSTVRTTADSPDPTVREKSAALGRIVKTLLGADPESGPAQDSEATRKLFMNRMLAVEVTYIALTGDDPPLEQDVLFMQISGNTPHDFTSAKLAREKLAGVQVNHFGAFYKKSWRVSDWTWGRIDGALRLTEMVLLPKRMRQLGLSAVDALALIRSAAVGGRGEQYLGDAFGRDKPRIEQELEFLEDLTLPIPTRLPYASAAIARRSYLEVLDEQLSALAAAVEDDIDSGASMKGNGPEFLSRFERTAKIKGENVVADPKAELDMFGGSNLGRETITGDAGSDLFAITTSKTAAVASSVISTGKVGVAKTLVRAVRTIALLLYALVFGAVTRSKFGSWAVNLVLATGGALLAISLLSDNTPAPIKAFASAIVLAGFLLATLRANWTKFAFVLMLLLVALLVWLVFRDQFFTLMRENAGDVFTVVLLVYGLGLLGRIRGTGPKPPNLKDLFATKPYRRRRRSGSTGKGP